MTDENQNERGNQNQFEPGLINQSGCFLCGATTGDLCEHCGIEACSLHVSLHRGQYEYKEGTRKGEVEETCLLFRVIWREGVGRCVVATRDIAPLELILQDKAVVIGPNFETEALCVQCLGRVSGEILCEDCNLPFCSESCREKYKTSLLASKHCTDANSTGHVQKMDSNLWHSVECAVFSKLSTKLEATNLAPGTVAHEYGGVTVLRLLSLRDSDPDVWRRLQFLMDHDKERREEKVYWQMFQVNVVEFLRRRCNLADIYSEDDINWAIGILRTNSANLERPYMSIQGTSGKSIYPTFSFLSHSCICNARYIIDAEDNMDLRAQVPIRKGEEITIQYISFLFGNTKRRKDIKACWMFECTCVRCTDTTEFGTYLSALLCPQCSGPVLPITSCMDEPAWECEDCKHRMPQARALDLFNQLEAVMFDTYDTDAAKYAAMLEQYSKYLHKNNFQMLLLERYLADTLKGKVSLDDVKRKMEFNQHFIQIFDTVDPGHSKWRAVQQYEVCKLKLILADCQHSKNEIDKDEFIKVLKENIADITEAVECLQFEPIGSKEHRIRTNALSSLAQAKDILLFASCLN